MLVSNIKFVSTHHHILNKPMDTTSLNLTMRIGQNETGLDHVPSEILQFTFLENYIDFDTDRKQKIVIIINHVISFYKTIQYVLPF